MRVKGTSLEDYMAMDEELLIDVMKGIKQSQNDVKDPNLVQKIAHNWYTMLRNLKPNQIADAIHRKEGKTQLGCKDFLFAQSYARITLTTKFAGFEDGFDQLREVF